MISLNTIDPRSVIVSLIGTTVAILVAIYGTLAFEIGYQVGIYNGLFLIPIIAIFLCTATRRYRLAFLSLVILVGLLFIGLATLGGRCTLILGEGWGMKADLGRGVIYYGQHANVYNGYSCKVHPDIPVALLGFVVLNLGTVLAMEEVTGDGNDT